MMPMLCTGSDGAECSGHWEAGGELCGKLSGKLLTD